MIDFEKINGVHLIAEIGINHNGDLKIATRLIDAARSIGWNGVKFQKRTPSICVPEAQKNIPKSTPWGDMTYIEYKEKIEFGKDEYDFIDKYCKQEINPIEWSASIWDKESLNFIMNYEIPYIKIPSAMVTNHELIKEASISKIPIIISTGMSTLKEIDDAVNIILKHSFKPCILHTNSSYPAPLKDLNLSLIPMYKKRYDCTIGYSGHEYGVEPSVLAVALGAKVIERHVTIDRDMWGTDQKSSLSITGMDNLFQRIKNVELVIGEPKKIITDGEKEVRKKLSYT